MCGLACILTNNREVLSRKPIMQEMLNRIYHRGPDGGGIKHIQQQGIFGHRRLAIIDLDHGSQPMNSEDGRYTLIFNGEIYNYIEIRQKLRQSGISIKTNSDSEVLLHWLIKYGSDHLTALNGMFAFVFHDRNENRWIAARDHFGIKPLYFAQTASELIFASEIKSILAHPEIRAERDQIGLKHYMSFQFCLGNRTLFSGIKKISPGYYMTGHGRTIVAETKYWAPNYQIDYDHTESWFEEHLCDLLQDSVSLQLRSDVPLGSYLSGGLDSSLISALAAKKLERPLPLFHGRFLEGPEYDESKYAKILAQHVNGRYRDIVPSAADFVHDLPKLIYALDEPIAGPGVFPQYATSKMAAQHVKVVLGGQGGDEIFGGYARYLVAYLEQSLKGSITGSSEEGRHIVTLESIVPNLPLLKQYLPLMKSFWEKGLFEDMDARYFHLINRGGASKHLLCDDLHHDYDDEALFADFQLIFNEPNTSSYINKMTNFDQKTLLPSLLQIEDRVSMAVSLESRVPFLDRRIVDLMASLPPTMKFKGGKAKSILITSMKKFLPREILDRKDKMGFPVPLSDWMQGGPVREFVHDTLFSKSSLERGIYKEEALHEIIDGQGVGARQLWGALSLELWHQSFIDAT